MKKLSALLTLSALAAFSAAPALASDPAQDFCERYQADQKRIADVYQKGWTSSNRGCLNTPWIDDAADTLCNGHTTKVVPPKMILFYFDGAEYFSAAEAKDLGAVNITGEESSQSFDHGIEAMRDYWIPEFEQDSHMSWKRDVEFHYHSGDGFERHEGLPNALACFQSLSQNLADLQALKLIAPEDMPRIVISGHSNGGATAINFSSQTSMPIDLVLLMDPVPRAFGYLFEKVSFLKQYWKSGIPTNIKRVVDIYQQSDTGSLASVLSIHGSLVPDAQRIVKLDMIVDSHDMDHILMLTYPTTVQVIGEELSAAMKSPPALASEPIQPPATPQPAPAPAEPDSPDTDESN